MPEQGDDSAKRQGGMPAWPTDDAEHWPGTDEDVDPGPDPVEDRTERVEALPESRPAPSDEQTVRVPMPPRPPAPSPSLLRPYVEDTQVIRLPPPDHAPPQDVRRPGPPPQRAVPVRYDPPDDHYDDDHYDDHEPAPRPRKRRKGLLIGAAVLVVVLAAGAGAVYAVPGLAGKLGITTSAQTPPTAAPSAPIEFSPALRALDSSAPAPTKDGVSGALAAATAVPQLATMTGTVLDPASGTVLWNKNAGTALMPASTGKLLVSAAALLSLDRTAQYSTKVVAGDKPGTVVLVGGGDPTLNSLAAGKNSVYQGAAHLDDLVAQVKKSGQKVDTVLVDVSLYTGDVRAPGWDPLDTPNGYSAPVEPIMLDGARSDPLEIEKSARAARPARTAAAELAKRLGAKVPEQASVKAKPDAAVLGEVRSAPLLERIDNLLQISDNMLAETVLREVAIGNKQEPSFAGGIAAVRSVLEANGFDVSGYQMVDGSGLSPQNKVPAELIAEVLSIAAAPDGKDPRTPKLRPLLGGLPVAGGSGTLDVRFRDAASGPGKGWVRAKTGTLTGVTTLAGVVLDTDGRLLVFAFMSNGGADQVSARTALDVAAAKLRACGCG